MKRKLLVGSLLLGSVIASARAIPPPPPPPEPYWPIFLVSTAPTHATTDPAPFPVRLMLSILLAQWGL